MMKTLLNIAFSSFFLALIFYYSPQANASVIASINCGEFDSGFLCLASPGSGEPQQDVYTYFWTTTAPEDGSGFTCNNGPTELSYCFESCNRGNFNGIAVIDVTVVENATGNSDSASKAVDCSTGGGGGF